MAAPDAALPLIVDSRELAPYAFERFPVEIVRAGLPTGDYSLSGHEDRAAVERKALDDLIGCLTVGRDRFERELDRARSLECFAVVVEASMEDVARHRYTSRMSPHAALQSILAFQVRYGCPFVFAGSRQGGEYVTYWTLQKYAREVEAQAVAELEDLGRRKAARGKVGMTDNAEREQGTP
ncbi:ERCC4 domain-containing protein [Fundidesulfovibrio putealis]|uniref:ERCC4 domain-containing protein n=1 Tax=Fundidesulfovibrio putealis TaxID=270496 RepID=UPI00040BD9E0|nr:ERCC4 domain-containing protein [Fundidesulfovibrio putealis]